MTTFDKEAARIVVAQLDADHRGIAASTLRQCIAALEAAEADAELHLQQHHDWKARAEELAAPSGGLAFLTRLERLEALEKERDELRRQLAEASATLKKELETIHDNGFHVLMWKQRAERADAEAQALAGQGCNLRADLEAAEARVKALVETLEGHDAAMLRRKIQHLKQTDGEGWAAGELLERTLALAEGGTDEAR